MMWPMIIIVTLPIDIIDDYCLFCIKPVTLLLLLLLLLMIVVSVVYCY